MHSCIKYLGWFASSVALLEEREIIMQFTPNPVLSEGAPYLSNCHKLHSAG